MFSIILTLSIVGLILLYWFCMYIKSTLYSIYSRFKHFSAQRGLLRNAKVTDVRVLSKRGKFSLLECELEFANFSGERIREKLKFGDSKPNLKRFEVGKEVEILLNRDNKLKNPVSLKGINVRINWKSIAFYVLVGGAYLYLSFKLMNKASTKIWSDIPKYEELLSEMGFEWMAIGFIVLILFNLLLLRLLGFGKLRGKKMHIRDLQYYGLKSMSNISKYEDTGILINDNPVVRFYYSFRNADGQTYQGNDQLVIGKLEVGKVPSIKEKPIFYLPDSPEISLLEENLTKPSIIYGNSLRSIFLFIGFILSAITVGIFSNIFW